MHTRNCTSAYQNMHKCTLLICTSAYPNPPFRNSTSCRPEHSSSSSFAITLSNSGIDEKLVAGDKSLVKLQIHVCNFLNILIESKRLDMIKEIVKEFELDYNKLTETELAVVSSVVKLEETKLAQIAKQVQKFTGAKNVRIKTVIDESLVAGFIIRYGRSDPN